MRGSPAQGSTRRATRRLLVGSFAPRRRNRTPPPFPPSHGAAPSRSCPSVPPPAPDVAWSRSRGAVMRCRPPECGRAGVLNRSGSDAAASRRRLLQPPQPEAVEGWSIDRGNTTQSGRYPAASGRHNGGRPWGGGLREDKPRVRSDRSSGPCPVLAWSSLHALDRMKGWNRQELRGRGYKVGVFESRPQPLMGMTWTIGSGWWQPGSPGSRRRYDDRTRWPGDSSVT